MRIVVAPPRVPSIALVRRKGRHAFQRTEGAKPIARLPCKLAEREPRRLRLRIELGRVFVMPLGRTRSAERLFFVAKKELGEIQLRPVEPRVDRSAQFDRRLVVASHLAERVSQPDPCIGLTGIDGQRLPKEALRALELHATRFDCRVGTGKAQVLRGGL